MKIKACNALKLCLSTLLTLVFVALTQHLIQSTMRCENCIDSVDIDSIECIKRSLPCIDSINIYSIDGMVEKA